MTLKCWLLGHKFLYQAWPLNSYYVHKKELSPYCLRCGAKPKESVQ